MALTGSNNEQKIWNYLMAHFNNKYGVAGLMGNLKAESALSPKNLQDSFESKLGFTDQSYTDAIDSGSYTNFIYDSAGYGLAQWTFWSRKRALYEFAKKKKKSIGDLEMQLEFLVEELKGYTEVYNAIKNGKSVKEVSNIVLFKYEAPGNQSTNVQNTRARFGQEIFDRQTGAREQQVVEKSQKLMEIYQKSSYAKYLCSTGGHIISNSGGDEKGGARGGKAGDQTGNEWVLKYWYNRPWDCVLRYPDPVVGQRIAELGCEAALNDKIGYDQNERYTYWQLLQKAGYHPSKITTACEADCSAGVIANVKAVGYLMNINKLKDLNATYTGNMRDCFKAAGFQVLTDSKYTKATTYLLPGDILLNDVHHTATNITVGFGIKNDTVEVKTGTIADVNNGVLQINSKGALVVEMQKMLITCGYDCGPDGADGDFGLNTLKALRQFQTDAQLAVDGVYGPKSKAALEKKYKESLGSKANEVTFMVKVTADALNIRKGPGTEYTITGVIKDKGCYTIIEQQGNWGKLKSGAGWISLRYTKKI